MIRIILLVFFMLSISSLGFADKVKALRKQEEGMAYVKQENYIEALKAFEESYKEDPDPVILLNIGMAHKALYQYVEAIDSFQRFLESSTVNEEQRQVARKAIEESKQSLAKLSVEADPKGAEIRIGGEPKGKSPVQSIILNPGRHILEIRLEGYEPYQTVIDVRSGGQTNIQATLKIEKPYLSVNCAAEDSVVYLDNSVIGKCPFSGRISHGWHTLIVQGQDGRQFKQNFQAKPGESDTFDIPLEDMNSVNSKETASPSRTRKIVGWSGIWLGGVGIALGSVFSYRLSKENDNVQSLKDTFEQDKTDLEAWKNWSDAADKFDDEYKPKYVAGATIGFVSGAALMVTGVILLLTSNKEKEKKISFILTPGGVGGTF